MVSRKLLAVWTFFDLCLLSAGVLTVAMSIVWRAPNLLTNMVFTSAHLSGNLLLAFVAIAV